MNALTPEYLRSRLNYDAETGIVQWRELAETSMQARRWNAAYAGKPAGSKGCRSMFVTLCGRKWALHRLIWQIHYGEDAPSIIDHKNGDPYDNRIANLRAATPAQNSANRKRPATNTSGAKGVYQEANGRWVARVFRRRWFWCGSYASRNEAQAAYAAKATELFGDFARIN